MEAGRVTFGKNVQNESNQERCSRVRCPAGLRERESLVLRSIIDCSKNHLFETKGKRSPTFGNWSQIRRSRPHKLSNPSVVLFCVCLLLYSSFVLTFLFCLAWTHFWQVTTVMDETCFFIKNDWMSRSQLFGSYLLPHQKSALNMDCLTNLRI